MNEDDSPLVSAVIPAYNAERFLAQTIESVLGQTYPRIECLVINDGSTDRTAEIAKAFGDHVRYFEKANGGVSSARNLGIENANGEFIAFLDADDLWLPHKTERQIEVYRRNNHVGLIYSAVQTINETGEVVGEVNRSFEKDALERILCLETPVYLTMTGIVPKKVFEAVGGFDEELSTSADADMACRIALKYELAVIDEPLAIYRQHGNQMHLNLNALENDTTRIFNKLFKSGLEHEKLKRLESKAYSSLASTLAIAYFRKREYLRFLNHLGKAFWYHPTAAFGKFLSLSRKWR